MKIGLQLYTVRRAANNDLFSTLKAAAELGYLTFEYSYAPFSKENAQIINQAAQQFAISLSAIQARLVILEERFKEITQFLQATSCPAANISVMPQEYQRGSTYMLSQMLKRIDKLALRYADYGIVLNYHHHDFEFVGKKGSRQIDFILDKLQNANLIIDTYWVTKGGEYVPHLLEKAKGKVYGLHLRDYCLRKGFIFPRVHDCALGDGVIDFAEVIACAEKIGAVYGAVEQKTAIPFREITKSIDYLKSIGYARLLEA